MDPLRGRGYRGSRPGILLQTSLREIARKVKRSLGLRPPILQAGVSKSEF